MWLESVAAGRLVTFDPFQHQYQLGVPDALSLLRWSSRSLVPMTGARAFLESLYKERFIPLPGRASHSIAEVPWLFEGM